MVLSPSEEGDDAEVRAIRDAAVRGAASAQGPDDAEDAAHDAIVDMIASKTTFEDPVAVARRAGRFRGIDQGRRTARRRAAERAASAEYQEEERTPEAVVVSRLYAKAILEMARTVLTAAEFEAFVALYFDGGTISEAARLLAEMTGRSFESVRTQTRRAVEKMRARGGDE